MLRFIIKYLPPGQDSGKPVLDGEPIYEDHPVCFNVKDLGTSSAYDVRQFAYLDLFPAHADIPTVVMISGNFIPMNANR
jgi:hypothetical protein